MPLTIRQKTNSLFIIAILLIAVITAANFLHFHRFQRSAQDVIHTQDVLRSLAGLLSGVQDAETGQRGYLLTDNPSYLTPYYQGRILATRNLAEAERLTLNNPQQQEALARVRIRIDQKFQELEETINLQRNRNHAAALKVVMGNSGKILMDEIRREVAGAQDRERAIFQRRQDGLSAQTTQRMWILFTGSAASLALLLWMFALLKLEIKERRKSQEALQLSKSQLTIQTVELTAANKELEAFCYSVSHDLRAPLRGIAGFSQIVQEKYANVLDEEGRGYLERVHKGIRRMSQLIDDLLNLSRITRATMTVKAIDLAALGREVAQDLRDPKAERNVEWVIPPSLMASGDPQLLRTAFENLLGNALKFTAKRDASRIEIGHDVRPEGTVYFIRDNGAGFDMAYQDKLFHAFQRLHTTAEFSGTGVGLATVQRIIQRHHGKIWAEGKVGQGATFFFTLRRPHAN